MIKKVKKSEKFKLAEDTKIDYESQMKLGEIQNMERINKLQYFYEATNYLSWIFNGYKNGFLTDYRTSSQHALLKGIREVMENNKKVYSDSVKTDFDLISKKVYAEEKVESDAFKKLILDMGFNIQIS